MIHGNGMDKPHLSGPGGNTAPARQAAYPPAKEKSSAKPAVGDFARVLDQQQQRTQGISFSAHARQRLLDRSIKLDAEEMGKLSQAVDKAAAKGCRSSLLLYRDLAFVAGVANRTIITALDGKNMKEHLFTNIDSALIVE